MTDISAQLTKNAKRGGYGQPNGRLVMTLAAHIDALEASNKALVEAGEAVVKNATREDLHGLGAFNDVVTPYLIDDLSAAISTAEGLK